MDIAVSTKKQRNKKAAHQRQSRHVVGRGRKLAFGVRRCYFLKSGGSKRLYPATPAKAYRGRQKSRGVRSVLVGLKTFVLSLPRLWYRTLWS